MASVKVRINVGGCWLEADCETPKQAVKTLSSFAEVFGERECGLCKSTSIRPYHREVDGHDYYGLVCCSCGAQLSFGQHKNGSTLFAKRTDANGVKMSGNGWYHYQGRRGNDD